MFLLTAGFISPWCRSFVENNCCQNSQSLDDSSEVRLNSDGLEAWCSIAPELCAPIKPFRSSTLVEIHSFFEEAKKDNIVRSSFLKKILSVAMGDLELIKSSHRPPRAGENFGVFETVLQPKLTSRVHSGMCFGRKRHQKSSKISACGGLNLEKKVKKVATWPFPSKSPTGGRQCGRECGT